MNFVILAAIFGLVTGIKHTKPTTLEELEFLFKDPANQIHLYDINENGTREEIEIYVGKQDDAPSPEPPPATSSSTEAEPSSTSSTTEAEPSSTSSTTEAEPFLTTSFATQAPTSAEPQVTYASPEDSNSCGSAYFSEEITSTESSDTSEYTDDPESESSTPSEDESTTSYECGDPVAFHVDYRAHDDSFIHDLELRLECPGRLTEDQLHDFVAKVQAGASDENHPTTESDDHTPTMDELEMTEEKATKDEGTVLSEAKKHLEANPLVVLGHVSNTPWNGPNELPVEKTSEGAVSTLEGIENIGDGGNTVFQVVPDPESVSPSSEPDNDVSVGEPLQPGEEVLSPEEAEKLSDDDPDLNILPLPELLSLSEPGNETSVGEPLKPVVEELFPEETAKIFGGNPGLQVLAQPEAVSPSSETENEATVGEPLQPGVELSPEQVEAQMKKNPDAVIPDDDVANSKPQNDESHPIPATEDEHTDEPETLEEEATTGQNAGEEEQVLTEEEFQAMTQSDPHPAPKVTFPIDLGDLPHVPALSEEEAKKLLDVPDFKDVAEQGAVSPSSQPGNEASSREPLQPAEEELSPEEAEKILSGNPDLQVLGHPDAVSPSSEPEKEPTVGEPLNPDVELSPEQIEALMKENPDAVIPDDDVANSEPQNQISPDAPIIRDQPSDPVMSEDELKELLAVNPGYAVD